AVLNRRAKAGDRVMYVTNNSRWHREDYRTRLEGHGVPLTSGWDSIVTAARAAAILLTERDPKPRVAMVFGGPGLARELRDVGIRTVGPTPSGLAANPDVLIVGVDFQLSYKRLSTAVEAVRRGALFVAANRDPVYPGPDGNLLAGAGAMVASIAAAAMREPDLVVGKPEPRLFEAAAEVAGMALRDAVVIGDGITTDIRAANTVGARSVLMLTGVTTRDDITRFPEITPTRVAANSKELEAALIEFAG
ncbi:MAG TPA: HAD hydrolase-like protein, partial [Candidatus Limnocylindria bacterium]|nr:HAD hydrolase-like protein [Candidatus Limnocylindria bacterium]